MLLSHSEPETLTIPVEPEKKNMSMILIKPVTKKRLTQIYEDYHCTSIKEGSKINLDYGCHPVFQGFISAYKNDRPVTISPDIIWLLIVQAFTHHVSANAEELRSMFVNFAGKKELTVDRRDLNFFTMTSEDFEREIFPDFVKQISDFTGKSITDTMTPDFTTTTTISLAVGQLSIMAAMKNYFTYRILCGGCGFPYITIEGSLEDWEKIILKLDDLKKYNFEWFTKDVTEIVKKIIDTKKGNVDLSFWKGMIRFKDPDGSYSPDYVDGWFTKLFPYDYYEKRLKGPIYEGTSMPFEMLSIPVIMKIVPPGADEKDFPETKYELLAGFVGFTQNRKTASMKPEIGWLLRKQKEVPQQQQPGNEYQKKQVSLSKVRFGL